MIIAGFDVATTTGIAIMDNGKVLHAEAFRSSVKRPEGLGPQEVDVLYEADIGLLFRAHVLEMLVSWDVQHVAFELPRTGDFERTKTRVDPTAEWAGRAVIRETERSSSNSAMIRGVGLCKDLAMVAKLKNIPIVPVPDVTWRKAFLGHARAPRGEKNGRQWLKKECMKQCESLGVKVPNDDAADAVGIGYWLALELRLIDILPRRGDFFSHIERATA